jgi:ubiquinol-cytochrome c reductase iron-sulfur subunit
MDQTIPPNPRRQFLGAATTAVGGLGLVAVAIPFVKSMTPSERARAAGGPVEVALANVAPGTLATVEWRGRPVWVLHRTPAMLATLGNHDADLTDPKSAEHQQPEYARNATRAARPGFLVATAVCTHRGCIPSFRPDVAPPDLGPNWPGGFFCSCHGSRFDLAGRVFRNVPAPRNLEVPPYSFAGDTVVIGVDPNVART